MISPHGELHGVTMKDRKTHGAKVGAGRTAASGVPRKSLLQSVREGDFKESGSGSPEAGEVSAWLLEEWEKARKRDQAALAMERRRQAAWKALALLLALVEATRGAEAAARYFSLIG